MLRKMNQIAKTGVHIAGEKVAGCLQACVNSHEQAVRHEGGTLELIFDAI